MRYAGVTVFEMFQPFEIIGEKELIQIKLIAFNHK